MTSDSSNQPAGEPPAPFADAFDAFCVGLASLDRMRAVIAELLQAEPTCAESLLLAIDTAFREGLIKASTYDTLTTDIDRATSEDVPTEWSEETRQEYERYKANVASAGENDPADDEALAAAGMFTAEDTGHPNGVPPAEPPPPIPAPVTTGTVLNDRFELLTHLGAGSMGDVYEALDRRKEEARSANPRLAIKVISAAYSAHANALATLQREALNSQGLVHPNIIRVFDLDHDGDRYFMTMELLNGRSLGEMLGEYRFRPMPFRQARTIIDGACRGLQYAHEQGVIHADIKPGNLFVTQAGRAKILDFGIARTAHGGEPDDASPVSGAHTPAYSSCEVLEGAEPTAADDVFALACVAYRMLAGSKAFGGMTALDAERAGIKPQRIETLNPEQWHMLQTALAFRHADRTVSIAELAATFGNRTPTAADSDTPFHDTGVFDVGSRPGPLRWGIAAMVLALVSVIWIGFRPSPEPAPPVARAVIDPVPTAPPVVPAHDVAEVESEAPAEPAPSVTNEAPPPVAAVEPAPPPPPPVEPTPVVAQIPDPLPAEPEPEPAPAPAPTPTPTEPAAPVAAEPAPTDTLTTRIAALATRADDAMNAGRLRAPEPENALTHIQALGELAPEAPEFLQRRTRLTELMLLEAMVAITDEDFTAATRWIEESRTLGAPDAATERFESELQKARDARNARNAETLSAIFASATPAAILADPDIDFDEVSAPDAAPTVTVSSTLTMVLPGALPNLPPATDTGLPADGAGPEHDAPLEVPLSALEFEHFVEPSFPRRNSTRRLVGWVDVGFRVTTDGATADITVLAAEPPERFDEAAIEAISKWRFKPVYVDGVATEQYTTIRLRFQPE